MPSDEPTCYHLLILSNRPWFTISLLNMIPRVKAAFSLSTDNPSGSLASQTLTSSSDPVLSQLRSPPMSLFGTVQEKYNATQSN